MALLGLVGIPVRTECPISSINGQIYTCNISCIIGKEKKDRLCRQISFSISLLDALTSQQSRRTI